MRIRDGLIPFVGVLLTGVFIVSVLLWAFGQFTAQSAPPAGPFIGIRFTPLDPLGVRVYQVLPNSPASQAGIAPGDLIYTVNGAYVNGEALLAQVMTHRPDDVLTLGVQRGKQTHHIEVQVAAEPERTRSQIEMMSLETARNGFHLTGLVYDTEASVWYVDRVDRTDTLHAAGLRPGDHITAINGHHLTPATRHQLTTTTLVEDVVQLTVERDGHVIEVEVPAIVARLMVMYAMQTAGIQ